MSDNDMKLQTFLFQFMKKWTYENHTNIFYSESKNTEGEIINLYSMSVSGGIKIICQIHKYDYCVYVSSNNKVPAGFWNTQSPDQVFDIVDVFNKGYDMEHEGILGCLKSW